MKNILFGVSYLGTNYAGWQKQNNALGIQEVIENAMQEIGIKNPEIFASGRTDAGVHAFEQCFSAKLDFAKLENLPSALNSHLPDDIRILWAKEVNKDFHARFSAHKKTYVYRVKTQNVESPFDSFYTTYLNYNLNLDLMKKASKYFVGEHNFKSFCSSQTSTPDCIRTIYYLNITKTENLYEFEICGNGFLYNMVRIIVGTLVDIGRGKLKIDDVPKIFDALSREKAGKTMPAKGLILKKVEY